jgi:hypothetical protein
MAGLRNRMEILPFVTTALLQATLNTLLSAMCGAWGVLGTYICRLHEKKSYRNPVGSKNSLQVS